MSGNIYLIAFYAIAWIGLFAYLAVTPPGQHLGVLGGVAIGAIGSFLVGSVILKLYPVKQTEEELAMETVSSTLPAGMPA